MTVYAVKEQNYKGAVGSHVMDYGPAAAFGELKFITSFDMPLHMNSPARAAWREEVEQFITRYESSKDFIILTGQPIAIFCIGMMLAKANKIPRFLKWQGQTGDYRVVASIFNYGEV
jgi:deoxyxylulose-5-phosphate synthase